MASKIVNASPAEPDVAEKNIARNANMPGPRTERQTPCIDFLRPPFRSAPDSPRDDSLRPCGRWGTRVGVNPRPDVRFYTYVACMPHLDWRRLGRPTGL